MRRNYSQKRKVWEENVEVAIGWLGEEPDFDLVWEEMCVSLRLGR